MRLLKESGWELQAIYMTFGPLQKLNNPTSLTKKGHFCEILWLSTFSSQEQRTTGMRCLSELLNVISPHGRGP